MFQAIPDGKPQAFSTSGLQLSSLDAFYLLGPFSYMAPAQWETTVERIAVNCVMAGCKPEYFPVVLAALQAMEDKQFNLMGIQATTHPCGAMLLVNGPIAEELNINAGSGALGPCWRANATIGRALRLVMLNCGGAAPGPVDKATQGQPGK